MAIIKNKGTTPSERYLAKLANQTFLNLWCYPNAFNDKGLRTIGEGKELCDLLVVCGDDVLVFSDKSIAWPKAEKALAWRRWYRRSVRKSADQILGAKRWIDLFPERIFLDRRCTQRMPIRLPDPARLRFYGIVVALGAGEACRHHFQQGSGSLMIRANLRGDDHDKAVQVEPFVIGDINPDGPFIHVLDDATLDVALRELDTVVDFTNYLRKKEAFVRGGRLMGAHGEEDLIAYYMTHMNDRKEHDFTKPDGSAWGPTDFVSIGEHYASLQTDPRYIAKKRADKNSYVWDKLIEAFTDHMIAGTTITPDGSQFALDEHGDDGVRHMAQVPRYVRRSLGQGILDAMGRGIGQHRFTRGFLPGPDEDPETGFFFMTLAVPQIHLAGGYDQYRAVRRNMLETYAFAILEKNPLLKRVVGIAMEPPAIAGAPVGGSEDLVLVEQPEWTEELRKNVEESKAAYKILQADTYAEYRIQYDEWPSIPRAEEPPERRSKRKRRREAGKARGKGKRRKP